MDLFVGKNTVNWANTADVLWFRGPRLYVSAGAARFTGTAVGLQYGRIFAVASGAGVFTGTAVRLGKGFVVSADSGAARFAGTEIGFLRGYRIEATAGAGLFTGTAVGLNRGILFSMSPGAAVFTGKAVTLTHSFTPGEAYIVTAETRVISVIAKVHARKERVVALKRSTVVGG
jgi:hypothetical protein